MQENAVQTAAQQLADAQAEVAELEDLLHQMEEKVRDGGEVEPQEVEERYGLKRLAELRQEAAERRVQKAEAAATAERRQAALSAAREELSALSPDILAAACEEALQAIERVQRLGDARQAAIERHAQTFVDLGMRDRIRHQDRSWIVVEVDGVRFDTQQDALDGRALLGAIEAERARRAQVPGRLAKGFPPPEALPHPMAQLLAANADARVEDEEAVR